MAVVDDMRIGSRLACAPARQGQVMGSAEEEFEAVVVEAHADPVTDEARGHRVEHAAQEEAWTLLTKVETSCDRILIAGGANVEAEWEQGPAV